MRLSFLVFLPLIFVPSRGGGKVWEVAGRVALFGWGVGGGGGGVFELGIRVCLCTSSGLVWFGFV